MGGTQQVLMAAEIAMEHHLGPVTLLGFSTNSVYERNTMGAIKAINAAELALETDPRMPKYRLTKWLIPCGKPQRT
jgi:L-serine dehydratase